MGLPSAVLLSGLALQARSQSRIQYAVCTEANRQSLVQAVEACVRAAHRREDVSKPLNRFIDISNTLSSNDLAWAAIDVPGAIYQSDYSFGNSSNRGGPWLRSRKQSVRFPIPWVDLFNPNGYIRQRCLNQSRDPAPNPFLFGALLRRMNDWVPQVRQAGTTRLEESLARTHPDLIARTLFELTPRFSTWGRLESGHRDRLYALAGQPGVPEAIVICLEQATSGPAAKTLSQLARTPALDAYLERLATHAIQPSVRACAIRFLLRGYAVWMTGYGTEWTNKIYGETRRVAVTQSRPLQAQHDFVAVLSRASKDRSARVRRVAATAVIEKRHELGQTGLSFARQFAKDHDHGVRERGQFVLDKASHDT